MNYEIHIEVSGRVQGVSFRSSTRDYANSIGATGYVRNTPDGKVFILAQGKEDQLHKILVYAQRGLFPAKVTGMSFTTHEIVKKYSSFRIIKDRSFIPDQVQSFKNLGKELLGIRKQGKIPQHVVIIPDGNRRWAKEHGWKPWIGHQKAGKFDRLLELFHESKNIGVKYLTLWGFSTENWKRDEKEVKTIMNLIHSLFEKSLKMADKEGIRVRHFGRRDRLSPKLMRLIEKVEEETKRNRKLNVQIAIDYGGRDEIKRAFNKMLKDGLDEVEEETIASYLDSAGVPDPDLIIRTSGERRISGIMPFQSDYAELYFTEVPFPEFGTEEFRLAILDFAARDRRFGGSNYTNNDKVNLNVK